MSLMEAYFGGVHALFSIWIFCLMQVIPFFLAFAVGAVMIENSDKSPAVKAGRSLVNLAAPIIGFMLVFTGMGMTATGISKVIFEYLSLANKFGGVIIGFVALYFIGVVTIKKSLTAFGPIKHLTGFLFGAAIGFAYRPCVSPTLTKIYNITQSGQTVGHGGVLLVFYTLGIFTVICAVAATLTWIASSLTTMFVKSAVTKTCGALLLAVSALILTNNMTIYKSYLVGRFVPQEYMMDDHGDHM
ncbi:MAG TPA: hypothetical protein ENI77_06925 [Nitrospirae bacterium]|nr:hypothetical protein [Nitrospirota bacterium]